MHSDLEQSQRDEVMYKFKSQKVDILIATDIVSRGIDIDDIQLVVNYDVPHDAEDYVHRIGRTARAGSEGSAVTLVSEKDQHAFKSIEKFLEKDIEKNDIPQELGEGPAYTGKIVKDKKDNSRSKHRGGRGGKKNSENKPAKQTHRNKAAKSEATKPEAANKAKANKPDTPASAQKQNAEKKNEVTKSKKRRPHHRKPQNKNTESQA